MQVLQTPLTGVFVIEPDVFSDRRGYFMETYHQRRYESIGITADFVQDNISFSIHGTLRGLHYQFPNSQAKLIQSVKGRIFDVAVDIRTGSPTFGKWAGNYLSDENRRQVYIDKGFAHGFCVLSESAVVFYKCSDFYAPESERGILWSDPDLGISWPIQNPILSNKDETYMRLRDVPRDRLPCYES